MKKIVVITGAGISAESGIRTFRDANGLWEGHDIREVASPKGFRKNPKLVLDFYNKRRKNLLSVQPNEAHYNIAKLEEYFQVEIITQNVDDLHERAGSRNIIHLHGELLKCRSSIDEDNILECRDDIILGDTCKKGSQLRPHIVWFGESVPMINIAIEKVKLADIIIVIGTSLQVYPAAGLLEYIQQSCPIYFIDPNPNISETTYNNLTIIKEKATKGTNVLLKILKMN